jgi:hypothetical protein
MANDNIAFGLKPIRMAGGSPYNGATNMYFHPATDGAALMIGDPVIKNGSADTAGVPGCVRAAASAAITGVVQGFVPDGVVDRAGYGAASTAYYVLVADDPDLVFEIQEDSVGGALAAADIGLNADIIVAAGSTYSHLSGVMLDTSTKATTNTLPLKIIGLVQRPGNDIGANANVRVKINNHTEAPASTGV